MYTSVQTFDLKRCFLSNCAKISRYLSFNWEEANIRRRIFLKIRAHYAPFSSLCKKFKLNLLNANLINYITNAKAWEMLTCRFTSLLNRDIDV